MNGVLWGKMRILVLSTRSRNLNALVVLGVLWTVTRCVVCDELKGNVSEVAGGGNGTARNSRQLWSLVKNVIKTGLEQSGGNGGGSPVAGLGSLAAGLFGSALGNGVGNDGGQNQYYQQPGYTPQNVNPSQFANPNDYMHYLLANSQSNQHSSLPHYFQKQQKEQESAQELINNYREQMAASGTENSESVTGSGSQLLNKLAFGTLFDDLDKVTNFLSFSKFEGMFEKINKFDKLKCIPRLLCQMVSKRAEDQKKEEEKKKAKEREDISSTTRRPTNRKADDEEEDEKKSRKEDDDEKDKEHESKEEKKQESEEDDEEEEDDDDEDESDEVKEYVVIKKGAEDEEKDGEGNGGKKKRKGEGRTGRFLNLNGGDVALEQFVKFLDLMQLKDWSLYPYVNGAYQGHQVTRTEECAYRFPSCPFSDEQLVYYFNNYNGGFFQSI